ncbi:hypothetical protein JCM10449v2_004723 [Rhodotorula kratochvilovae]
MGLRSWSRNEWSEAKEAAREIWRFLRTHNWRKSARASVRSEYWVWWIVGIILTVAIVLLSIYRDTIIEKFEPHKQDIVDLPASWLIPVAILIIISFPPLGGAEIILMVVGLIWGVWIGFAIACAGTYIGEILCFWAFKYFFTNKANDIESKNIFYACIARLMRHGGLGIIIIVRFSAVPGHVVTAIQSTVGMSIWVYSIAIIVSLPKQLCIVYLGYMFGVNKETASPDKVKQQKIISLSVLFATGIATVLSLYIVYMRARKLYPEVLRDMEESSLSKSPLDPHAPGELPTHHRPLQRRSSLVEAAFDGDPGAPQGQGEERFVARENRGPRAHGMVRTHTSGTWRSSLDGEGDEWDAKSPAMRRGGDGAWQDGRPLQGVAELEYRRAEREDDDDDPAGSYAHLPLASESEVGAYPTYGQGPYGAHGGVRPVSVERPPQAQAVGAAVHGAIPYVPPEADMAGVGSRGGQYGAMGRSR